MANRILTGILMPSNRSGSATIHFNPHTVSGHARGVEMETSGASGDFNSRPGKVLSIREFRVEDRTLRSRGIGELDWFRINDFEWTTTHLRVSWECEPGAFIREISYLIIGEVATVSIEDTAASEVLLARDGSPVVEVVVEAASHRRPAEELVHFLNRLSTATFEIIDGDPSGAAIYLGNSRRLGIDPSNLGPDDFVVAAMHSPALPDSNDLVIAGGSELAGYYGVTTVLECLGCRWFFPDTLGEVIPETRDSLSLRPPLPRTGLIHRPSFRIRGVRGQKSRDQRDCGRRNFQNVQRRKYDMARSRLVSEKIQGEFGINRLAHSWRSLVPLKYRDKEHLDYRKEIFEKIGEVRCNPWDLDEDCPKRKRWNLCAGSEATAEVLAEGIQELLCADPNMKHVVVMPEDVRFHCECEACDILPETEDPYHVSSKRVLTLTNRVARILAETHPEIILISAAYNHYLAPPIDDSLLPEPNVNMIFMRSKEHNHALADRHSILNTEIYGHWYLQWRLRLGCTPQNMLLYEYYDKTKWLGLPWPIIHSLRRDIRRFHDDQLLGLWSQYQENFAPNGLVYYVAARLLWDVEADVEALMWDYCYHLFGEEAGRHVLAYYRRLETAAVDSGLEVVGDKGSSPYWEMIRLFTPELLDELESYLEAAGDVLDLTEDQISRISGLKTGIEYTRLMICWVHGLWYFSEWRKSEGREGNPSRNDFCTFLNMEVNWFVSLVEGLGIPLGYMTDSDSLDCSERIGSEEVLMYFHIRKRILELLDSRDSVPWLEKQKYIERILLIGDDVTIRDWQREWDKINKDAHWLHI